MFTQELYNLFEKIGNYGSYMFWGPWPKRLLSTHAHGLVAVV